MNENCLCVLVVTKTAKVSVLVSVSGVGLGLDPAGLGLGLGLGLLGLDNISEYENTSVTIIGLLGSKQYCYFSYVAAV